MPVWTRAVGPRTIANMDEMPEDCFQYDHDHDGILNFNGDFSDKRASILTLFPTLIPSVEENIISFTGFVQINVFQLDTLDRNSWRRLG